MTSSTLSKKHSKILNIDLDDIPLSKPLSELTDSPLKIDIMKETPKTANPQSFQENQFNSENGQTGSVPKTKLKSKKKKSNRFVAEFEQREAERKRNVSKVKSGATSDSRRSSLHDRTNTNTGLTKKPKSESSFSSKTNSSSRRAADRTPQFSSSHRHNTNTTASRHATSDTASKSRRKSSFAQPISRTSRQSSSTSNSTGGSTRNRSTKSRFGATSTDATASRRSSRLSNTTSSFGSSFTNSRKSSKTTTPSSSSRKSKIKSTKPTFLKPESPPHGESMDSLSSQKYGQQYMSNVDPHGSKNIGPTGEVLSTRMEQVEKSLTTLLSSLEEMKKLKNEADSQKTQLEQQLEQERAKNKESEILQTISKVIEQTNRSNDGPDMAQVAEIVAEKVAQAAAEQFKQVGQHFSDHHHAEEPKTNNEVVLQNVINALVSQKGNSINLESVNGLINSIKDTMHPQTQMFDNSEILTNFADLSRDNISAKSSFIDNIDNKITHNTYGKQSNSSNSHHKIQIQQLQQQLEYQKESASSQISNLEAMLSETRNEMFEKQQNIMSIEKSFNEERIKHLKVQQDLELKCTSLSSAEQRITVTKLQLDESNKKCALLNTENMQIKIKVTSLEESISEMTCRNETLTKQIDKLQETISTMETVHLEQIQKTKEELQSVVDALNNEKLELDSKLRKTNTELSACQQTLHTTQNNLSLEKSHTQRLNQLLESLQSEKKQLGLTIAKLEKKIAKHEKTIENLTNSLESTADSLENAQKELNMVHKRQRAEELMRRHLRNQIEELRGTIRVYCRVRPLLSSDKARISEKSITVQNVIELIQDSNSKDSVSALSGLSKDGYDVQVLDEISPQRNIRLLDSFSHIGGSFGRHGSTASSNSSSTSRSRKSSSRHSKSSRSRGSSGSSDSDTNSNKIKEHDFRFDRVFGQEATQDEIYEGVQNFVLSSIDGYKTTLLAYGVTGSGKTFTMEGYYDENSSIAAKPEVENEMEYLSESDGDEDFVPSPPTPNHRGDSDASKAIRKPKLSSSAMSHLPSDFGIIPRSIFHIFDTIQKLKETQNWEYTIEASFTEIYNDELYDLLNPKSTVRTSSSTQTSSKGKSKAKIVQNVDGTTHVTGFVKKQVSTPRDVMKLLNIARNNRKVASTSCNDVSSRSHSIFTLNIFGFNPELDIDTVGVLNLVDLAGSERINQSKVSGSNVKETVNINQSLSALGDVISSLASKSGHVPFRNSRLTHYLQNSLSGEKARTCMLLSISPVPTESNINETLNALRFGEKVNKTKIH